MENKLGLGENEFVENFLVKLEKVAVWAKNIQQIYSTKLEKYVEVGTPLKQSPIYLYYIYANIPDPPHTKVIFCNLCFIAVQCYLLFGKNSPA